VGDFDPAEVNTLLAESIGNWKSPTPYVRVPQQAFDVKETSITIETPDKANAFFISGKALKLKDDDPDYAAMELADYIVGGGFLNSRLMTQIRQKEGLSYFVGSQFYASPLDQYGQFVGLAIYLLGVGFFKRGASPHGKFPLSHLAGLCLLAPLALLARLVHIPALAFGVLTLVVLAIVAIWEWVSFHGGWREHWQRWRAR